LRSNIKEQMDSMTEHLSNGSCKDFADYSKCCGIIQGLAQAEREILDAKARYEKGQ